MQPAAPSPGAVPVVGVQELGAAPVYGSPVPTGRAGVRPAICAKEEPFVSKQFVHLHVHTDYSMIDGESKLTHLLTEVARISQPAIAMTDHVNMYGGYAFYKEAKKTGIKPILGIEAYLAPQDRFHKTPVFWGEPGQRSDDLSGGGSYTHMTMVAKNSA